MLLDALYLNGRFRTGAPDRPLAYTLGVFGGMIAGLDEEVTGLRARRVIDLGGAPVVPGLHDAHHHLSARGRELMMADTAGPLTSADSVRAISLGVQAGLAEGLTSITEPGISGNLAGSGPGGLAAFQAARDEGLLELRVTVMPEMSNLREIVGAEADLPGFGLDLGLRTGLGDDWLRLGAVKIFGGALSSQTLALRCHRHGNPGNSGAMRDEPAVLAGQVRKAHQVGWQVAVHAIGDAAVDIAVDACERAMTAFPRAGARHRIEHCGLADDATIARIAALGLIPVPQGRFTSECGAACLDAIGAGRAPLRCRPRAFLDAGIELTGSSGCPVSSGAPLLGIHSLVNGNMPDGTVLEPAERLSAAQALRAFTYGSAYAERTEHRKGTLTRGKLADFAVLSDDLLDIPAERIGEVTVRATIVGGIARYGTGNLKEL